MVTIDTIQGSTSLLRDCGASPFTFPPEDASPNGPHDKGVVPKILEILEALDRQTIRADVALRSVARQITANATNPQFFFQLAESLRQRGRLAHAEDHYRRAIQIDPEFVEAHVGLSATYRATGRLEEAAATLRSILELSPGAAAAHAELAAVLVAQGDATLAAEHYYEALRCNPDLSGAWFRLGSLMEGRGEHREALVCYQHGLAPAAADPGTRLAAGLISLQLGEFAAGWQGFEYRTKNTRSDIPRHPDLVWDDAVLGDQTVLIRSEGNTADDLMFASCLPDVLGRVGRAVLECPTALSGLFARSFPDATVLPDNATEPAVIAKRADCETYLGSLPQHVRGSLNRFPLRCGYLVADSNRRQAWQQRLASLGGRLNVGIAWQGKPTEDTAATPYAPLTAWEPILQIPEIQFISLQGEAAGEGTRHDVAGVREQLGVTIHQFESFPGDDHDDLAALVAALDLVITVPSFVAHLSGALGASTWVPLRTASSWRWMLQRDTSPWYPSMRLYRQSPSGDWSRVFAAIAGRLRSLGA